MRNFFRTIIMASLLLAGAVLAADPAPTAATSLDAAKVAFQLQLDAAINKGRYYPKKAVLAGEQGTVIVEFDYLGGGKATNATLGAVTASRNLNEAAIHTVERAVLPPKPPELASVTHFQFKVTFTLGH